MTNNQTGIRVLIADDHAVVREGIRAFLTTKPGMAVVGEASNGAEAVEAALRVQPDVILMDLLMPEVDGISAIHQIRAAQPDARVLVLTSFATDDQVFPAIKAGALGYLLKDSGPADLIHTTYAVEGFGEAEPPRNPLPQPVRAAKPP